MESRWRFNIAKLGMSGTDWRLCARLLGIPSFFEYYLVTFKSRPPGTVEIWEWRPGFPDPGPFLYLGPFYTPGGRFPLTYNVETDTP